MARHAQDRENLLRDATAFERRIEFQVLLAGRLSVVFVGFRAAGGVSLYFDGDPVYHFNSRGELRRAFVEDQLIQAEEGRLVGWTPRRGRRETEMLRADIDTSDFCTTMLVRLRLFQKALVGQDPDILGQVPPEVDTKADLVGAIKNWLAELQEIKIADSPRVS